MAVKDNMVKSPPKGNVRFSISCLLCITGINFFWRSTTSKMDRAADMSIFSSNFWEVLDYSMVYNNIIVLVFFGLNTF